MPFRNRFPNVTCRKCGQPIAIGEDMNWDRTNGGKYHANCSLNETQTEGTMDKPKTQTTINGNSWLDGFADAILPRIEEKIAGKTDAQEVELIVKQLLNDAVLLNVTKVQVNDARTGETKDVGLQHKLFPRLLQLIDTGLNVWLTGPAGSGKTTAVEMVAEALNLKFYHLGAMDNEYKLRGFVDAQGRIVHTLYREWATKGGVICFDELDSWLPSATLALNGDLANGHCTFPDGMFARPENALAVGCANTWGNGATNDYVGRMKHDAAFVDRWVQLDWGYDEAFEIALANNAPWTKRVQHLRRRAKEKGLKVIISPRASIFGAKLLANGVEQEFVEQVTIRKGMTDEQWSSIQ